MKRITTNIINDAKKILGAWQRASEENGTVIDKEWQIRECASMLGVEYETLKKRI